MSDQGSYTGELSDAVDGTGLRVGVVTARFNSDLTEQMMGSVCRTLVAHGVADEAVDLYRVPGAWELPQACARLARWGGLDAIIAIGVVIRGDTPHFDYISAEASRGLMQVSIDHDVPVIFGVLTTDNRKQAEERADPKRMDKGREIALASLEMATLFRKTR